MGTLNMLGLAKRIGARFLLTSTSEVYRDPLEHPQKETYWGHVNPIGVRSCYDEGIRTAETFTMDYHRGDGVEVPLKHQDPKGRPKRELKPSNKPFTVMVISLSGRLSRTHVRVLMSDVKSAHVFCTYYLVRK